MKKNCGFCGKELKKGSTWCIREKSPLSKHFKHYHPMFCSDGCRVKYVNMYNYAHD